MSGSPAIGLMLCFSAFIGFEATTIYSEEARNPERTVPLATYFSVLLIGGFYTLSTWAVVNGTGVDKLMAILGGSGGPTELLFGLSDRYAGHGLSLAMRVLFVTSTYASLLAFHNAIARYFYAMGREGVLPEGLGRTHARFASPHTGSLAQSALAFLAVGVFAIAGADPVLVVFTLPSALATLGIIVLMAIVSLAAIRYLGQRRKHPAIIGLTAVALVAFIAIAALTTIRFDVLAGTASTSVAMLPWLIPAAGVAGVMLTRRLRACDPGKFARLGETVEA